jgi:hypothetical protein
MSTSEVRKIADAILYEGYALYPYRASSLKNRLRWTFGGLYPEEYGPRTGDRSSFQTQILIACANDPVIEMNLRFLHLIEERKSGRSWQTGMEREIHVDRHLASRRFNFAAWQRTENELAQKQAKLDVLIDTAYERMGAGVIKFTLRVANVTEMTDCGELTRDQASLYALISAHAILHVSGGEFVSLTDPPADLPADVDSCKQEGVWPVLVGQHSSRDCMLVSPIILADYPQVAPESAGDLFDGAEIDEILTLRILTMTDSEKDEMRQMDERTRRILERTENLSPDQLIQLHGTLRSPHAFTSDERAKG